MAVTHTEWQYSVCPVCGYLDEDLNHDFEKPDPSPPPPRYSREVDLTDDFSSREHLRTFGMGSSRPSYSYGQEHRYAKEVPDKGVWGKDVFAEDVWGPSQAADPPPPPPVSRQVSQDEVGSAMGTLGFTASMSKKEMRGQFRRLLKENHPDINSRSDATEKTIAIHDAYSLLQHRGIAE